MMMEQVEGALFDLILSGDGSTGPCSSGVSNSVVRHSSDNSSRKDLLSSLTDEIYDVQAIILAGGGSDGLMPLSSTTPKALLTIGHQSLICGSMTNLWRSGIRRFLVVTNKNENEAIETHVRTTFLEPILTVKNIYDTPRLDLNFYPLMDRNEDNMGTTDVLRCLSDKIEDDFLVVPCDLYGSFDFKGLIEQHRSSVRLCTVTLIEEESNRRLNKRGKEAVEEQIAPGGNKVRGWGYKYRVMATLDTKQSQLVGISDMVTVCSGASYELSKWMLMRHRNCTIRIDLFDAHIYMFSKHVFEAINLPHMYQTSIRLDLVPYIIRLQETPASSDWYSSVSRDGEGKMWTVADLRDTSQSERSRVFYYLGMSDSSKCSRINSLESVMNANMEACFDKTVPRSLPRLDGLNQKMRDVVLSIGFQFGDSVNIRMCVIGAKVSVGCGCKLSKCIIMDNVKIEDNVVLEQCIIGERSVISAKTKLKYVVVSPDQILPTNTYLERDFYPPFLSEE